MSNVQQAPGYWQASDGQWYPPERHPNFRPPGPASAVPNTGPPPIGYGPQPGTPVPPSIQETTISRPPDYGPPPGTGHAAPGNVKSGTYLPPSFNGLHTYSYKSGWVAVFGEVSHKNALATAEAIEWFHGNRQDPEFFAGRSHIGAEAAKAAADWMLERFTWLSDWAGAIEEYAFAQAMLQEAERAGVPTNAMGELIAKRDAAEGRIRDLHNPGITDERIAASYAALRRRSAADRREGL